MDRLRDQLLHRCCIHLLHQVIADQETAVVIDHTTDKIPNSVQDMEVGEVRLPELVDMCRLAMILFGCLEHQGRFADQTVFLQQPVDRTLADTELPFIGDHPGKLPGIAIRIGQRFG